MDLSRDYSDSVLQDLLAGDTLLPEQFWNADQRSIHISGERALMWAVFADGIDSFRRNAYAASAERQLEFLETERWLLLTDWDWPFSFVNLCEAFGFDPSGIRQALRDWKNEQRRDAFRRQRFRPVAQHAA